MNVMTICRAMGELRSLYGNDAGVGVYKFICGVLVPEDRIIDLVEQGDTRPANDCKLSGPAKTTASIQSLPFQSSSIIKCVLPSQNQQTTNSFWNVHLKDYCW